MAPRRASPGRATGAQLWPHCPTTSVVTPWCTWLSALPLTSSVKSECVCKSTKPGHTASPFSSMRSAASRGGLGQVADAGDPLVANSDVGPERLAARSIEHLSAGENHVDHDPLLPG